LDFLGYGATTNCSEGAVGPGLNNTTAAFRNLSGCVDTDDNASDFSTGAAAPRNSASSAVSCQRTLTYLAGANGSISGTTPQSVTYGGGGTPVTAVPDAGFHFVSWSDGVLTASRTELNVTADLTVTATFAANQFTLTYLAGANGSISGTTPQTVNQGADGTAGHGGARSRLPLRELGATVCSPRTRTDTNVQADLTVTATFAAQPVHADLPRGSERQHLGHDAANREPGRGRHGGHGGARCRLPLRELERRCAHRDAHRHERAGRPHRHRIVRREPGRW
jgi:hypothetical protein